LTLYAVGSALEKNPEVVKSAVTNGYDIASHAYRWIDYHNIDVTTEKEYIRKQMKCLKELTGAYPKGWYYGRLSPRSRALVWDVYQELGELLVWESDSYCDDVPYWVDVPAEKDSADPKGMLMIPYS
jgi:peptidoglycan/xylan/chitin deacetylase (PgdA/CDA1 family)